MTQNTISKNIINKIRNSIANDELDAALHQLQLIFIDNPLLDEVIHQAGRFATIRRQIRIGVVSHQEATLTNNQIRVGLIDLLREIENKSVFQNSDTSTSRFYKNIIMFLKTKYENRISQKLANRQPVNLRKTPTDYGASMEASSIFIKYEGIELESELFESFDKARGRMLLLGVPGAGKTTLLLQLSIRLINSQYNKIPIVVNLATWKKEYSNLEQWLLEVLPLELGVNQKLVKQILFENYPILLFDGLDEVKEEDRISCLESIGRYGVDAQRMFVISSRKEEYRKIYRDAPVNLQIEVGNLTIEQIETELLKVGHSQPEALRLLYAIQNDELLRKSVQNPFYFNTLQLLFASGKNLSDLNFLANDENGRKREIVENFVQESLVLGLGIGRGGHNNLKRHLSFMASEMNKQNLVTFELANLTYSWVKLTTIQKFLAFLLALFNPVFAVFAFLWAISIFWVWIPRKIQTSIFEGIGMLYSILLLFFCGSFIIGILVSIISRKTSSEKKNTRPNASGKINYNCLLK